MATVAVNPTARSREAEAVPGKVGLIAGILFVALSVVSFLVLDTPDGDSADEQWSSYWLDSDNRAGGIVASLTMLLAAIAFLFFLAGLRRRLAGQIGMDAAYGAGIAAVTLMLFAGFGAGLIPVGHELADIPVPTDPDVIRLVDGLYFGVIFLALPYAIAGFMLPLCWALRNAGPMGLPSWLAIVTGIVGIVALSGPFLFVVPHILFLAWALLVCVLLLSQEMRPA